MVFLERWEMMKQPKKLTRDQKELVSSNCLNAKEWSLVRETESNVKIINKITGKTKVINK